MKSITKGVASLLVSCWFVSCMSSGLPNETVQKAFNHRFGKVESVSWTHNNDYSFAHFKQHGKPVVAVFGNDGQIIDTESATPIN
ncbi:hypothetical protein ACFSUS_03575 [Spirosoma soli]|uniref:Uncharacterized protein n=1 Tax=Spirosoma soli TaxID=1770529 RepID=A0ABW5LY61_9BACT